MFQTGRIAAASAKSSSWGGVGSSTARKNRRKAMIATRAKSPREVRRTCRLVKSGVMILAYKWREVVTHKECMSDGLVRQRKRSDAPLDGCFAKGTGCCSLRMCRQV